MKKIFALVLIVVGIVTIVLGHQRAESVAGVSDKVGTAIANTFDGKARQPDHIWYYVGGGALILIGAATLFRGKSS